MAYNIHKHTASHHITQKKKKMHHKNNVIFTFRIPQQQSDMIGTYKNVATKH